METKKTILTGTVIATAILGAANMKANTSDLFDFTSLGSGSEVRANLVNAVPSAVKFSDLSCGEKKDAKTTDTKAKDGKCGEAKTKDGKCGDKKDAKTSDAKSKDGKCGEGKCGEKKAKNPK
jgi:uncharacterized low-complexity protein